MYPLSYNCFPTWNFQFRAPIPALTSNSLPL